jgi:hypothetical protein
MAMLLRRLCIVAALGMILPASSAWACPYCQTAREVRAGIYDEDFAYHLGVTLLPFGVFLGIAAAIHRFPQRKAIGLGVEDGGR